MSPSVDAALVERCSRRLWSAECERRPIEPLTRTLPGLDRATARAVQLATFRRRSSALAGFKLGGTVRPAPGGDRLSFGRLGVAQRIDPGDGPVDPKRFLKPCIEPEIALRLARDLSGEGHTRDSVAACLDTAIPALELADTRYPDYPEHLVDNIADNCSAGAFVLGEPLAWSRVADVRGETVRFFEADTLLGEGAGADVMGDPLLALAWLAAELARCGEGVPAGSVVLTGGLTRSAPARPGGLFRASFSGLGDVGLRIAGPA